MEYYRHSESGRYEGLKTEKKKKKKKPYKRPKKGEKGPKPTPSTGDYRAKKTPAKEKEKKVTTVRGAKHAIRKHNYETKEKTK